MAMLITIFQCDHCSSIVALRTEEEWRRFEATWWEGFVHQFCPACRHLEATRTIRAQHAQLIVNLAKQSEEEILDAELINC